MEKNGVGDTGVEAVLKEEGIKYVRTAGRDELITELEQLGGDAYIINLECTDVHRHWTLFYYDSEKEIFAQYDPDPATVLNKKVSGQDEHIDSGYTCDDMLYATVSFIVEKDDWQQE